MAVIEFKNICKSYGEVEILKDFSLKIEKNEFLCLVGSSGCGKTTLLKLINGLIEANSGEVLINNKEISTLDIISHRRQTGYVIQEIGLFSHLNVEKNIAYVLNLQKIRHTTKQVEEIMGAVGLETSLMTRYPSELSGGQRQRVGIARALIARPQILLMDEPFSATDEITRKNLQEEILKIYKAFDVTVFFITHDIKEALKLATQVLVMNKGGIEQKGTPNELLNVPKTDFVKELLGV